MTSRSNSISLVKYSTNPTDRIALAITEKEVYFVPKGIDKFFPDLQGLHIHNTKLKSVKQEDFKNLTNLIELRLRYNNLQCIDGDSFVFNHKLQSLQIHGDDIKFIGENLLEPLKELTKAYFSNNYTK